MTQLFTALDYVLPFGSLRSLRAAHLSRPSTPLLRSSAQDDGKMLRSVMTARCFALLRQRDYEAWAGVAEPKAIAISTTSSSLSESRRIAAS